MPLEIAVRAVNVKGHVTLNYSALPVLHSLNIGKL